MIGLSIILGVIAIGIGVIADELKRIANILEDIIKNKLRNNEEGDV